MLRCFDLLDEAGTIRHAELSVLVPFVSSSEAEASPSSIPTWGASSSKSVARKVGAESNSGSGSDLGSGRAAGGGRPPCDGARE